MSVGLLTSLVYVLKDNNMMSYFIKKADNPDL